MKPILNARKIENFCITISIVLVAVLSLTGILAVADYLFGWDILSAAFEKIAFLLMWAAGIIIGAMFLVSLMVNLSLISLNLEKMAEKSSGTAPASDSSNMIS